MKIRWEMKPITVPLDPISVWEHPPLDYYKYGEYPRFIRPPHPLVCRYEWIKVKELA